MIKPEILSMVEECKRQECGYSKCKWDKTCDEFMGLLLKSPVFYPKEKLENIISFLTSQEVCECDRLKEFEKILNCHYFEVSKGDGVVMSIMVKYCPFCGGKIKKGE